MQGDNEFPADGLNNIISSDNLLISRIKQGDKAAFSKIVTKYQKKIYQHVYRMVLDHDQADDITQEVFIKAYRAIDDFRGESGLYTWLYRIAVNYSLNYLKKRKAEKTISLELVDTEIKTDEKQITDNIDEKDKVKLIEWAISTLPEQQRSVFSLRFYERISYEEISVIMDRSVGAVKANYFHAFKKISALLKEKLKESFYK